ncbi:MAG: hypothetical protein COA71_11355 [SAR86 cluster bacterium]|uniref:NAD-dependent epimerase/dehydratase domain-containing protein n=1 Tax=SAR86 cluster bacterium TaxID=2030880 RepID=A0A2A5C975_9GAMM|nr:MAG: hypothetical protein COA71_11355 [SAR86 cluster bacterium]
MLKNNVYNLIFSSSANVYSADNASPMKKVYPVGGTVNPYGTTKHIIERFLKELCVSVDTPVSETGLN